MPIHQRDILKVCEILAEQEGLRVTTRESVKGACCAFGGALVGGLFGGPIGLGVGGAVGSVIAACRSRGKFKSAVHIIMYEMSEREKQKLAEAVQNVVQSFDASDVITLVTIINANSVTRVMVVELIKKTLTNDMGLSLV